VNGSRPQVLHAVRKTFDRGARRRREIEWHAVETGAADSDDLTRWLIAWTWHNPRSRDQVGAVIECARRMGRRSFTATEAAAVIEEATLTSRRLSADNLARFLGVTYEVRHRLGLTTIGSINVGKRARKELRKRRDRIAKERKRRERGARPRAEFEANSLSQTKPWVRLNMSRRQWYRMRQALNGTGPSTAVFLSTDATPVPPEGKRLSDEGSSLLERMPHVPSAHFTQNRPMLASDRSNPARIVDIKWARLLAARHQQVNDFRDPDK
jgi:hypothetical protein